MTLGEREEALVQWFRALPEAAAEEVIRWTQHLAELSQGRRIEWSDAWSEEDLRDAAAASVRNYEEQERNEL